MPEKLGVFCVLEQKEKYQILKEIMKEGESPEALCVRLAREKALKVKSIVGEAIVIGSDQVAVLGDRILGKPHTRERAIEQLTAMQGQTVYFLTALCIISAEGKIFETMVPTVVTMKNLSKETIEHYTEKIEYPLRKAAHATEYLILTLLAALPFYTYGLRGKKLLLALFLFWAV